jgi:hypothetical protein
MRWKQHLIYWIRPLIIIPLFALGYFAGPPWVQNIISARFNRELGLMENVEHSLILAIVIIALLLTVRVKDPVTRGFFLLCFLASVFLFLEEIDFGYHFINYAKGIRPGEDPIIHNIHNKKRTTIGIMMKVCYAAILLLIIILPHLKKEKVAAWIQNLVPSLRLHFTVLVIIPVSRFPFLLNNMDFSPNGSLHQNLSEFEELGIYYTFLLYFLELYNRTRRRKLSAIKSS